MAWTTPDLSSITDALLGMITDAIPLSPMWTSNGGVITKFDVTLSGAFPDVMRKEACDLSLTLMHVAASPAWRNTPNVGPRGQLSVHQPLALDLTYLLSSFAGDDFHKEQQAMSIALSCMHARPIFKTPAEEFTIQIEPATLDELSRLWQSITMPMRLSALVRVAVIFLQPKAAGPPPADPPRHAGLVVAPAMQDLEVIPQLFAAADRVDFDVPGGATPEDVTETRAPPFLVPGGKLLIGGQGLDLPQAAKVYLSTLDGTQEWDVTAWRKAPASGPDLVLEIPATIGLPANAPPAGQYRLQVGRDGPKVRSEPILVAAAPRIDGLTDPPVLLPAGSGIYTIQGLGFTPGQVGVALGPDTLTSAASPTAGHFTVNAGGTEIKFRRPAGMAAGRYAVWLTVGGVTAPPVWWIVVP